MVWWRSGTRQTCCPLHHLQTHTCSFHPPVRHLMSQHQQVQSNTVKCASICTRASAAGRCFVSSAVHAVPCNYAYALCFSVPRLVSEVCLGFVCFTCIMTLGLAGADLQGTGAPSCGSDETNSIVSAVHSEPLQNQQPALQSHNDTGSILLQEQQQQPSSVSSSDASVIPSDAHQQPNSASQQQAEDACSDHQHGSELEHVHLSSIHQQPQRRQQQWQRLQSQQSVDAQPSGQAQASSHLQQQQQPGGQGSLDSGVQRRQIPAECSNQGGRPVAVFASAVTGAGLQELLVELERKVCG